MAKQGGSAAKRCMAIYAEVVARALEEKRNAGRGITTKRKGGRL